MRSLAVALILVFASSALSAGAAPVDAGQSVRADISRAQSLVRQGKFDEALTVLAPLMRSRTVHADTAFQYGLAAIGASQAPGVTEDRQDVLLDEAIGVFHAMLVKRPDLVRVRLEFGRAFFLKGEDTLARRHFEQVLAGKPPAAVALNVNRFLTPDPGAQAVDDAGGDGAGAGHQYRRWLG